jgi:hypothetical protein
VRIANLASHVLALTARQVQHDWWEHYQAHPVLLETLSMKHASAAPARAANWKEVGITQGRGRMDSSGHNHGVPQTDLPLSPRPPLAGEVVPGEPGINLLDTLDDLLLGWQPVFAHKRTWNRARRLTLGMCCAFRQHLTSQAICASGRQFVDLDLRLSLMLAVCV